MPSNLIAVISLNPKTTIYPLSTEKIEVKKNEAYNVASSNSSPILAAANRPVSELEYHYVRTDPIVTIKCGDHQGRSGMF